MHRLWSIVYVVVSLLHLVLTEFIIPGLPSKTFVELGHLNLGVLVSMSDWNDEEQACTNSLSDSSLIHHAQAIEYAVKMVNKKGLKIRNTKLGFAMLDDCLSESQTAAQSLAFVPVPACSRPSAKASFIQAYDVIGIIGSWRSSQSIALAQMMGPMKIPVVSYRSTSDELSDKLVYPYFLRTVPPDKYQFQAISTLLETLGWTYVSVVYENGNYGENGFKQLSNLLRKKKICLAAVQKVSATLTDDETLTTAHALYDKKRARAVLIIASRMIVSKVIQTTASLFPQHFIWLGPDSWSEEISALDDLGELLWDSLLIMPRLAPVPDYDSYFRNLKPGTTSNPWFLEFWKALFNCSQTQRPCGSSLQQAQLSIPDVVSRIIDTVHLYASAIDRVLERCHGATDARDARSCMTGPALLSELKKTNQTGYTDTILMNQEGDRLTPYTFYQLVRASPDEVKKYGIVYKPEMVASYDPVTENITFIRNLTWKYISLAENQKTPESRCSSPCQPGEARLPQVVACCWLCQLCRLNEHLVAEGTRCKACPIYTWPDVSTNTCKNISVDMQLFSSPRGITLTMLAFISCIGCFAIFACFVHYHQKYVIRNTSPVLWVVKLLAILLGNVTVMTLQAAPNEEVCRAVYFLFCFSFTLMYGSILIRSLCIYNTFAIKIRKKETYINFLVKPVYQLVCCFALLVIQIHVCSIVLMVHPSWHKLTMKDVTKPYVELSCVMHEAGLAFIVVYNLLMVVICAWLAFKTRRLPDNFNESSYISTCIGRASILFSYSFNVWLSPSFDLGLSLTSLMQKPVVWLRLESLL